MHIFTDQKTLLHTIFYLLSKSSKAFSVSLKAYNGCLNLQSKVTGAIYDRRNNLKFVHLFKSRIDAV